MTMDKDRIFIVIGPDDKAYGPFTGVKYLTVYDWAVIKFNGEMFSIYSLEGKE